jgi:hypothetical protein
MPRFDKVINVRLWPNAALQSTSGTDAKRTYRAVEAATAAPLLFSPSLNPRAKSPKAPEASHRKAAIVSNARLLFL